MFLNNHLIEDIINRAIKEDLGPGDLTSDNLIAVDQDGKGVIRVKEEGIIAGLEMAGMIFNKYDENIVFNPLITEGKEIDAGAEIAEITGPVRNILKGERIVLNFLQRLSGIATRTHSFVELIQEFPARIVDTRKTTPTLRILEKYAVKVGGGNNHRMGLYDAVMIKDNHIKAVGSITEAVKTIRVKVPHTARVEVEVEDMDGVREACVAGADIIMLDNMNIPLMTEAVNYIGGKALVEASGGITEQNVADIAETGVDIISVGALTHHLKSLDISLDLE